jgi:capsular polysaccharide transport system permease protein
MFKNISVKSMDAFNANKALFVYKQVKPIDTIVSRFLIEVTLSGIVILLLLAVGWFLGLDLTCKNIFGVMIAYIWMAFFGLGLGIFFAVMSFFYENFKKIINLMFLPMFFLSGLFYTLDSLPPMARDLLLYNPVVHFMEMIRGNYFYPLHTHYVSYTYMLFWTLIPMFFGLWIYKKSEKKIIMS